MREETLRDTDIAVRLTPRVSLPSVTEPTVLVIRKHPAAPVVRVRHLITAVLAVPEPVTDPGQLDAGPVVTSPLTAVRPAVPAVGRAGDLGRDTVRNTNSRVSRAPGVSQSEVAGAVLTGEQVAAQMSLAALIAAVRAVFSAVADIAGLNTEAVPASPAGMSVESLLAVSGWREGTGLAELELCLLLLLVALGVTGAVEDSPPVPGPAAGLVVEVEEVTALARPEALVVPLLAVRDSVTDLLIRQCPPASVTLPGWEYF